MAFIHGNVSYIPLSSVFTVYFLYWLECMRQSRVCCGCYQAIRMCTNVQCTHISVGMNVHALFRHDALPAQLSLSSVSSLVRSTVLKWLDALTSVNTATRQATARRNANTCVCLPVPLYFYQHTHYTSSDTQY